MAITEYNFKNTLTSLANTLNAELVNLKQEELEQYWFFEWDDNLPIHKNTYQFTDLLELYRRQCRRWEEHNNGNCMVVERVRDTYLMPKIKEFTKTLISKANDKELYECP